MGNLFDPEFYPTPPDVILKMVLPYADRLASATVLEPSAGSGAILDFITQTGVPHEYTSRRGEKYTLQAKADAGRVYAVEKNPELAMILNQKGYRVIGSDFMEFEPEHRFDLTLMNPPFSKGTEHLLRAWEMLKGGDIACLLNAETLRNPCTKKRELLSRIIEEHGSVEWLGRAFSRADNPTDVEVALVRLHRDAEADPFAFRPEGAGTDIMPDFGQMAASGDSLSTETQLDAYVRCWEQTKAAAEKLIRDYNALAFYSGHLADPGRSPGAESITSILLKALQETGNDPTGKKMQDVYNRFLDAAKASAWQVIFAQIGLGKYMTSGLKEKLDEFRHQQGAMSLTKENILRLFRFIMGNIGTIMDQSIVEVYDLFTRYFSGNTCHEEGWKTNKRFRCNRKVILPNAVDAGYMVQRYGYRPFFSLAFRTGEALRDIDKAMCWLTGTNYDSLDDTLFEYGNGTRLRPSPEKDTLRRTIESIPVGNQDWHKSTFFRVKAFKKGTVHLEFKSEDLLARFNIAVNKGKNQIGMKE